MAVEKFIHGKVDSAKHAGMASHLRRMAEANQSLIDYQAEKPVLPREGVIFPLATAQPGIAEPREMFTGGIK